MSGHTISETWITDFRAVKPRYEAAQERILAWFADAHALARARQTAPHERDLLHARFTQLVERCACGPDKIARRSLAIPDIDDPRSASSIYDLANDPHGAGSAARSRRFEEIAYAAFKDLYPDPHETCPIEWVHVTCTGYVSPSAAQRFAAERGVGARTRVTHAYHMGCYAAFPALRCAAGALRLGSALAAPSPAKGAPRVDIVHTELCSLHFDPSASSLEQLVVHSLFADGFIRYSVASARGSSGAPALRMLALFETIIADSADAMHWSVGDHGMVMTLARDVPERIAASLREFVTELYARAGLDVAVDSKDSLFAVHPGGPRILDGVRDVLELGEEQIAHSRTVLYERGNMSSATLPHIWQSMVLDPDVSRGTLIASLAFGPGLTLCGALFRKE